MGLFPASPLRPTLAVDLNMLHFVNELFVRSPPNTTAWCDSLEAFLGSHTYKLESKDAIRHRFGNALQWYGNLIAQKELLISGVINEGRLKCLAEAGSPLESDDIEREDENYEPPPSSSPTSGQMRLVMILMRVKILQLVNQIFSVQVNTCENGVLSVLVEIVHMTQVLCK